MMQESDTIEMPWGDVPLQKPTETLDCNLCSRKLKLTEDEKYVCELCGSIEKADVWHP